MGVVYKAWDEELGVVVALKVVRPEITRDPVTGHEVEHRFKRELLLARQVTDRHVVRIHDLGDIGGIKYITMPFIEGEALSSMLTRTGRIQVPQALNVARQVASGLVAAHDVGVVHRDLKPENVMIDHSGHATIMDFGIARSVTAGAARARRSSRPSPGVMRLLPRNRRSNCNRAVASPKPSRGSCRSARASTS